MSLTQPTPLPKAQIAILCLINASEGVAMNIIWSYVPFLVAQWYDDDELGVYVGLLASSFFVTQSLSAIWWGKLSDRVGRRPILIVGAFGSALSMTLFGFSRSYEVCVAGRLCAGLLNGNLGIVKSYLGEITDQSNRARGFSFLSLVWGVTSILAPAAGGFLAKPADRWSPFQTDFWKARPYLLPSLLSIMVSLAGSTIGFFLLPESPKWRDRHHKPPASIEVEEQERRATTSSERANGRKGEEVRLLDGRSARQPCPCSCCQKLWSPTLHACLLYSMLGFTMTQFDELIPLLGEEKQERGGLGFTTTQIGLLLSIGGGVLLFYQGVLFPAVSRRLGAHKGYTWGMVSAGLIICAFPTVSMVRKQQMEVDREWVFWVYYTLLVFLQKAAASTAFTFSMMLINDYTPPGKLGSTNGVAHSMAAFSRIFSPTLAGGVWAASMQLHQIAPFGTFISYLTVSSCCLIASLLSCLLPPQETLGFEVL